MSEWTKGDWPRFLGWMIGLTISHVAWFVATGDTPWGSLFMHALVLAFYAGRWSLAKGEDRNG